MTPESRVLAAMEDSMDAIRYADEKQISDLDLTLYGSITAVNEGVLNGLQSTVLAGLTNLSYDTHIRAIENAYNEYITFTDTRKVMQFVLKSYVDKDSISSIPLDLDKGIDLAYEPVAIIRPAYLTDFVNRILKTYRTASDPSVLEKFNGKLVDGSLLAAAKANAVKSHRGATLTDDEILRPKYDKVPIDTKYVSGSIEYLDGIRDANKTLGQMVNATKSALHEAQLAIGELAHLCRESKDKDTKVFLYNSIRSISDLSSYIAKCMVVMIKIKTNKILRIAKIQDAIAATVPVGESADNILDTVCATDTKSLADELRRGSSDAYDDISRKVYQYHKSVLENSIGDSSVDTTAMIQSHPYEDKPYQDAAKIYIMIRNGIDIISRKSDEYILVFDNLIEEAGFQLRLDDKYRGMLETLDDIVKYTSAADITAGDRVDTDSYIALIRELGEYPQNMENIAECANTAYEAIKGIKERLNSPINGEYRNSEAMNQLKIFFEDLEDQYEKLTSIVASKFLLRLKSLTVCAEKMSYGMSANKAAPVMAEVDVNFTEGVAELNLALEHDINVAKIILAQESYIESRFREQRGASQVFLEDDNNGNQQTNTTNNNANNSNQNSNGQVKSSPSVTDNSQDAQDAQKVNQKNGKMTQDTVNKIVEKIKQWFENTRTSFKNILSRKYLKEGFVAGPDGQKLTYQGFLKTYKDYLMNKSYTNTEIHVLPYNAIENIYGYIGTLKNNLTALQGDAVKGVNTEMDMYKKLFTFVPNLNGKDTNEIKQRVTQFLTVGNQKAEDAVYKNNDVATWVKQTIPFLEQYSTTHMAKIDSELKGLETQLETVTKTYTEAFEEVFDSIYSLYQEADDNAGNNTNQNNPNPENNGQGKAQGTSVTTNAGQADEDTVGVQQRSAWMRTAVMYFTGSVCNVIRDRVQNSFKILAGFSDKANKALAAQKADNDNNDEQNTNEATEDVEYDNVPPPNEMVN